MSIQFQAKYLRETQVKEMSGTGGATGASGEAASATFKSGVGMEYTTKKNEIASGTSINNATDYKIDGKDAIYKFTRDDKYYFQIIKGGEMVGIGDKELHRIELAEDAPMLAHGKANIKTYTKDGFKKTKRGTSGMKGIIPKDLWEDEGDTTSYTPDDEAAAEDSEIKLEEARNYHQFKREAATRTKAQQMHEAAKMINNKLDEINRLLEYTNQMRSELSEGEEQLEYKHNTKALFEKMNKKVVEAYTKLKKVK